MEKPSRNMEKSSTPNIAIVCDWLTATGGAERVVEGLHSAFPDAPIYTSTFEAESSELFEGADIRTSWMQKLPKKLRKHQYLTIPRQWFFGRLRLHGYDIVISAGSNEAKAAQAPDGTHINICYTPTLQYWVKPENYLKKGSDGLNPIWRLGLKTLLPWVRKWDLKAAQTPDVILAISTEVQNRITKFYDRESDILYPPADIERFAHDESTKRSGFVVFGRHVQHKRFDLAIAACNKIKAKLVVIGDGPDTPKLKAKAGPTIEFVGRLDDNRMVDYIASAEAFIFPNEEDYGIVAVEAQAAGTPVIAYRAGGALDTVVEGVTGEFFDEQSPEVLAAVLQKFDYTHYSHDNIVKNAERFSKQEFITNIQRIVSDLCTS